MSTLEDTMYRPYEHELAAFGKSWCGPDLYAHHERTLVARYECDEDDSDGHTVEVYCEPWPARFYDIVALPTKDYTGKLKNGFTLSTGSGCSELAASIAEAICEGMLSLETTKDGNQ